MKRSAGRKQVQQIICLLSAVLFIVFFCGELDMQFARRGNTFEIAVTVLGFMILVVIVPLLIRNLSGNNTIRNCLKKDRQALLLLLVPAILPRVVWWIMVPPLIDSDYGLYVRMGQHYATYGQPELNQYMVTIAPNTVLYSVLTGTLMRLFGKTAETLIGMCIILNLANIFLLYGVCRKLTSVRRSFFAAVLFALLPENVFYSNIPGIEAPALFTILVGLFLLLSTRERNNLSMIVYGLIGSAFLAISACIRPNAWVVFAAAVPFLLFCQGTREYPLKKKVLMLLSIVLGISIIWICQNALKNELFKNEKPVSGIGWSLYEGLDLESGGQWTEEKSARCIEVIYSHTPEEADKVFFTEALERYHSYTLWEKIRLFMRKGGSLWYETRYAVFTKEGTAAANTLDHLAIIGWASCLAFMLYCMLYRWNHAVEDNTRRIAWIPLLIILLTTAWHEMGTSIGRYHYMLIPFVLMLIAVYFPEKAAKMRTEGKTV